jgi:hypothetical protein
MTLYCLIDDINIWEEPPASLFHPEDAGSRSLINVLPICDNTQHHNPEDHNPNIPADSNSDLSYWRQETTWKTQS